MDVDENTFWPQLVPILTSICDAAFVTIDVEMSGIAMRGSSSNDRSRNVGRPSLQEHYEEIRQAALKYKVLQIGITCIEEDRDRDMYFARPYNFNVSPLLIHGDKLDVPRDITFQSGAVQFLIKHSFDIGAVFTRGVPYLSREEEALARISYNVKQDMHTTIPDIVISPDDHDTLLFYSNARKAILDFSNQKDADFVNVGHPDGLSGMQRRLVHQLIRNEFPSCRTFARRGGEFMQIEKSDPEKELLITKQRLGTFESSLARQTGLRFLFEALAGGDLSGLDPRWFCVDENNKSVFTDLEPLKKTIEALQKDLKKKTHVLVGHNMFTDLIFIYQTFFGTLPEQVTEFNKRIHELFPIVFDTKYLATQAGSSMRNKSSLKDLCDALKERHNPFIALAERHVSYGIRIKEHEAGFDSWMTAQVFIKLSGKLAGEQGIIGDLDGATDSIPGTSGNAMESENVPPDQSVKPRLSRNARRAASAEKKLRIGGGEKHKTRASGSSTSSVVKDGTRFRDRIDTPFSNTNMFDNLHVEGENDGDSSRSPSPEPGNGGVSLASDGIAGDRTLMDLDMDDDFKASFDESGHFNLRSTNPASTQTELPSKDIPGGISRYYYAAKLNGHGLPSPPGEKPKESPWIPNINNSFWNIYANRLRVYGTETEVCYLGQ